MDWKISNQRFVLFVFNKMKEFDIGKISKARCEVNELYNIPLNENKGENIAIVKNSSGMKDTEDKERSDKHKISVTSGTVQQSADFETAMLHAGYGKFNYMLLFVAFPASCVTFFDVSVISLVLPAASCDLQLNDYTKGFLIGATYAGMILTSFLWGFLSDTYGRKRFLVIGYLLDTICNICASFSQSFIQLFIFKFVNGLIVCGILSILMVYNSEMLVGKPKDRIVMQAGIFISLGGIIHPTLAWILIPLKFQWSFFDGILETNSWRMFIIVSTLPAFISTILTSFCVESPKFLLSKGRNEEALEVFRTIYSINTGKPRHMYPIKQLKDEKIVQPIRDQESPAEAHKISHVLYRTWLQLTALFRPPHVKKSLIMFAIQFGALMSVNNLRLWMPVLFQRIHKGAEKLADASVCDVFNFHANLTETERSNEYCLTRTVDSYIYTNIIFVSVASNLVFILGSYLSGKIQKKNFIISAYLIGAMTSFLFVWVNTRWTLFMAAVYLSAMQASVIGLIGITVELFPTNLRAMAVSLTMMFGRLGVVTGSMTMPIFMSLNCWTPYTVTGVIILCSALGLLILTRKPT